MVVLADENELNSPGDLQGGIAIGVQDGSQGEVTAREVLTGSGKRSLQRI